MRTVVAGLVLACLYVCSPGAFAVQPSYTRNDVQQIHLRTGTITPPQLRAKSPVPHRSFLQQSSQGLDRWGVLRNAVQLLVALEDAAGGVAEAMLQVQLEVEAAGGVVSGYVPDNTLLVVGPRQLVAMLHTMEGVLWVGPVLSEYKIAPEWQPLLDRLADPSAIPETHALLQQWQLLPSDSAAPFLGSLHVTNYSNEALLTIQVTLADGIPPAEAGPGDRMGSHAAVAQQMSFNASEQESAGHVPDQPYIPASYSKQHTGTHSNIATTSSSLWRSTRQNRTTLQTLDFDQAAAALSEWHAELTQQCHNGRLHMERTDRAQLAVSVSPSCLLATLQWLAGHAAVHWLAPQPRLRTHNWAAGAIIQSGMPPPPAPVSLDRDNGTHPFWAVGLTGSGQVVGAGDNGIDMNSCFFNDPLVPSSSGLSVDASGVTSFSSQAHRKLRLYRQVADGLDGTGHGTHTVATLAGSLAGPAADALADYRGMAPDAKIAFIDLGSSRNNDAIYTPANLATDYFPYSTAVGGWVQSNSWGSSSVDYDALATQLDQYSWQNQDFLAVYAAGNEGYSLTASPIGVQTTVSSPGTAKNALTVGATQTAGVPMASKAGLAVFDMSVAFAQAIDSYKVLLGPAGPRLTAIGSGAYTLSVGMPADGCSPLQGPAGAKGTVVLLERGGCYLETKVQSAAQAGAVASIVFDGQANDYFVLGTSTNSSTSLQIPVMFLPRSIGLVLSSALTASQQLRVSFRPSPPPAYSFHNLAPFSSQGPTKDGRIKPDIVAPGTTISARVNAATGDTCTLGGLSGTSSATPVVAGAAVLARQYFMDGFYPSGARNASAGLTPSGPLLKAVLLGGAAPLEGVDSNSGLPLAPPPSFRQGWGLLQLQYSLPLKGSSVGWNLQLVDRAVLRANESHSYCIQSTGGPLRITLVWHDYPSMLSAQHNLVNDLDLAVMVGGGAGGMTLLGNSGGIVESAQPDRLNNVEQVSLRNFPAGPVSITVSTFRIFAPGGPQPYALTVHGNFTGALVSPNNPASGQGNMAGACSVAATITSGPSGLSSSRASLFQFTAPAMGPAPTMFECRLTDSQGNSSTPGTPLHDWQPCTSPQIYITLPDGQYRFSVRVKGESTADVRTFTKDTTPPVLSFTGPLPLSQSDVETVSFNWQATDATAVSYRCMVSASISAMQTAAVATNSTGVGAYPIPFSTWQVCTSPQVLIGLMPGGWTFSVSAQDAANNTAQQNLTAKWTIALSPAAAYARLVTYAPVGLTPLRNISFKFHAVKTGTAGGSLTELPSAPFGCRLQRAGLTQAQAPAGSTSQLDGNVLTGMSYADSASAAPALSIRSTSVVGGVSPGDWGPCASPKTYLLFPDGMYTFSARVSGASVSGNTSTATAVSFQVDGTPPVIQVVDHPAASVASSSATFRLSVSKEGSSLLCQLSNSTTVPTLSTAVNVRVRNTSNFLPCTSPAIYSALPDRQYQFSAYAVDKVGNQGEAVIVQFLVDTKPPTISNLQFATATNQTTEVVTFNVTDGNGSGVSQVVCRLRPKAAVNPSAVDFASSAYDWQNCSSPQTYTNLAEGRWGLSIRALDAAQLSQETPEADIIIDLMPPVMQIVSGPNQSRPAGPSVTFAFNDTAAGVAGAPIRKTECLLQAVAAGLSPTTAPPLGSLAQRASSSQAPAVSGMIQPGGSGAPARAPGGRHLMTSVDQAAALDANAYVERQHQQSAPAAYSTSFVNPATPLEGAVQRRSLLASGAVWTVCSNPVQFNGLVTGSYSLQVRGTDAAGNQGPESALYPFSVSTASAA